MKNEDVYERGLARAGRERRMVALEDDQHILWVASVVCGLCTVFVSFTPRVKLREYWIHVDRLLLCVELSFSLIVYYNTMSPGGTDIEKSYYVVVVALGFGAILYILWESVTGWGVSAVAIAGTLILLVVSHDKLMTWLGGSYSDAAVNGILTTIVIVVVLLLMLAWMLAKQLHGLWQFVSTLVLGVTLGISINVLTLEVPFPATTSIDALNTDSIDFWITMLGALMGFEVLAYRDLLFPCCFHSSALHDPFTKSPKTPPAPAQESPLAARKAVSAPETSEVAPLIHLDPWPFESGGPSPRPPSPAPPAREPEEQLQTLAEVLSEMPGLPPPP